MENDFVLTQTRETTMTSEKTVTIVTEKLETEDENGRRYIRNYRHSKSVQYHADSQELRMIA